MALGAKNIRDGRVYTSLGSSAWIAVSSEQPVLDEQVQALRICARHPEDVHLGSEHLLRRDLLRLGEGQHLQ